MSRNYFITGTDTDIGKTLVAEALLLKAASLGQTTVGLKPVAAGADETGEGLRNGDAVILQRAATVKLSYEQINPVLFKAPIAPHIAAQMEGRRMTVSSLAGYVRGAMMTPADFRVVEGAGGWLVPLNDRESMSTLVKSLELDVIMVVGLKLGCLNHALLTSHAIISSGLRLAGWVATQVDPDMLQAEDNLESLKKLLGAPMLGYFPYEENISANSMLANIKLPD